MPFRKVVSKELAVMLGVLSHPDRIRIIEELADGEKDVGTLAEALETSPVRVSQHLSLLRSHHLVSERREGRHVFYRQEQADMAGWLLDGLKFLERGMSRQSELHDAVESAVQAWGGRKKGSRKTTRPKE